jgi:hypothetical protein
MNEELVQIVLHRLDGIERLLAEILGEKKQKSHYSTQEVAEKLGKAEFTVREWCRLGRVRATKRATGRGCNLEWMISHEEVERISAHGLLPQAKHPTRIRFDEPV